MASRVEFPSGVGCCQVADPAAPDGSVLVSFRERLANVYDDEGLLAEMEQRLPPERRMPWANRASRDWALRQLERGPYPGLSEQEQIAAIEYVKSTPFYE